MRARLLIIASAIGMLGWGAVLPFQYAYAADTRGWGALVAAAASSLFSVGALLAAPVGGRLSDRHNPVTVAVVAQLVGALGPLWLLLADSAGSFLLAMLVFGLGLTASVPAHAKVPLQGASDSAMNLGGAVMAAMAGSVLGAGGFLWINLMATFVLAIAVGFSIRAVPHMRWPGRGAAAVAEPAGGAAAAVDEDGYLQIGASSDTGGRENHRGPSAAMWKQSSRRTPNLPGR